MSLNAKTLIFSAVMMAALILALTTVSLLSFRHFSLISAEEHTRTAAEIIRLNLTEAMVNGTIDRRESFLSQLKAIEGLDHARVVRGPDVISQYGPGLGYESQLDLIEEQVVASGQPFFALIDERGTPAFRATIPYIATRNGNHDCLLCHQTREGAVLGAVTLVTPVEHLRDNAITTVAILVLAVALFTLVLLYFLRRMTRPLTLTANEVHSAMLRANEGDFTTRIQRRTNDEVGQIADDINRLTGLLYNNLQGIRNSVAQLLRNDRKPSGNLLSCTSEMVHGLIEVAHFKQAIEEDESREEVYQRLARVIEENFHIHHFSIYEASASKNRITTISVDGEFGVPNRWCDNNILVRSDTCRACRTGHVIDAVDTPHLCNAFRPAESGLQHICLPIIQSGSVGSVVQLLAPGGDGPALQEKITLLRAYLREAAPVLEAKRLMDTLRESTLRDAMTGLHNRRFLEEYVDTMAATTARRDSSLSVMMLDLDYFKKVNDTYGHDVGDTILKSLAKVLQQNVRASDMVIRYGGEEFMVILQDTSRQAADAVAEKIRASVEAMKLQVAGTVLQKTISIGIADYPEDGETMWQVIKYADVALYQAKEQGRNRVVRFNSEMWSENGDY